MAPVAIQCGTSNGHGALGFDDNGLRNTGAVGLAGEADPSESRLVELARTEPAWLRATGPDSDIVVSSRIRLARNVSGFPFMVKAETAARAELVRILTQALQGPDCGALEFVDVDQLDSVECQLLMERQLISRELTGMSGPRGVCVAADERTSVMLNEEDHLRLQVLDSGMSLTDCWNRLDGLDNALDNLIDFAFDAELGYLTACPTNVGTGIRVSVMLHLPALRLTREIKKVNQAAQKINLAVRGLYGEGSQALGDFYQISNQATLGKAETTIIESVQEVVSNIIGWERRVRDLLLQDNREALHDQIARAFGVLTSARSINSQETLHLLSSIRLGIYLGLIPGLELRTVNELFIRTQAAHLQILNGEMMESDDRNRVRAEALRDAFGRFRIS